MAKPIQEVTANEAATVSRVTAKQVAAGPTYESWDVGLYGLAINEPIASDVCTVDRGVRHLVHGYVDVMLGRVGLQRVEDWRPSDSGDEFDAYVTVAKEPT